jgi:hypothetical protein
MAGLKTLSSTAVDVDGNCVPIEVCQCSACDSDLFAIFKVEGRQHVQCASCGVTYCAHEGPCAHGTAAAAEPAKRKGQRK